MSVAIEKIVAADPDRWDRVWAGCEYATFFHSRHWLETWVRYSNGARANASKLVTFSDGASAIVVLSSRRRAAGLLTSYESGPRGTYGGWISDADLSEGHARALADYIVGLGDVEWYTNPFDPNAGTVSTFGSVADSTDALDLASGFDAVAGGWSSQHRRSLRKAVREGVVVREADGIDDWKAYFDAYRASVDRWGAAASTPYTWEMFRLMAGLPRSSVRLWLSFVGDVVAAGAVCGYSRRHVAYWHGAARSELFASRPVHLLFHSAIADACQQDYRWFDFNPSGGLEGVRKFKVGFGTQEFPCPTVRRETSASRVLNRIGRGRG